MKTTATASGKLILWGEHAVVYGQPAIAIPVLQCQATATVEESKAGLLLSLPDIGEEFFVTEAPTIHPLGYAVQLVQQTLGRKLPPLKICVTSSIPVASGLGSGAATAVALIRALLLHCGNNPEPALVSALSYQVEKLYHGTPSGIDNTVIAYGQPVWFVRSPSGNIIEPFVAPPLPLIIANTGVFSSTKLVVEEVRRRWSADPERYNALFAQCGEIARAGRDALAAGDWSLIGRLMTANHQLLQEIGVSSAELDDLVSVALRSGALGAKLSGAGWGGNLIVLSAPETIHSLDLALRSHGAVQTIIPFPQ